MFSNLSQAEAALSETQIGVGAGKIKVARIAKEIREKELYKEHTLSSGKTCTSFDDYLRDCEEDWKRISGLAARRVRALLGSYLLFVEQLEYSDNWLLEMGEHAYLLARVANTKNYILEQEDMPLPNNGKKLGFQAFSDLIDVVSPLVQEGTRSVKATREQVDDILGKAQPVEMSKILYCKPVDGDRAIATRLDITFDGRLVSFLPDSTIWSRAELLTWADRDHVQVMGLGDAEFTDAHLRS